MKALLLTSNAKSSAAAGRRWVLNQHVPTAGTTRSMSGDSRRDQDVSSSTTAAASFLHGMFSLEGKSCIVSGGGSGIGGALATVLARAGASVVLLGRRQAVLEETTAQIQQTLLDATQHNANKNPAPRAFCIPCDVSDFTCISDIVKEAEYLTGIPPTILVNHAGFNVRERAEHLTSDHFVQSFNLMLTAPFLLTRALSGNMQKAQHGRVLNIASLQSFRAFPDSIPYAACKSGILGLTRALAEAYSPVYGYKGITVNAIAPGYVDSTQQPLTPTVTDEQLQQNLAAATILGRNAVTDDLAGACLFLCSPSASYITGQTLNVDGGFSALLLPRTSSAPGADSHNSPVSSNTVE